MRTIKKLMLVMLLAIPMAMVADYLFKTLERRTHQQSDQLYPEGFTWLHVVWYSCRTIQIRRLCV